jgi:hypothetical protein
MESNLPDHVRTVLNSLTRWKPEKLSRGIVCQNLTRHFSAYVGVIHNLSLELISANLQPLADKLDNSLKTFLLDVTHREREKLLHNSQENGWLVCDIELNRAGILDLEWLRTPCLVRSCVIEDCIANSQKALIEVLHVCLEAISPTSRTSETEVCSNPGSETPSKTVEAAYQSYCVAEQELGSCTDKEAYDWLEENSPVVEYVLPTFESWAKYVRAGRKHYGTNKNTKKAKREVRAGNASKDPDLLRQTSNQYKTD